MKKFFGIVSAFVLGIFVTAGICFAETYAIDPVHSEIGFAIKHMSVSNVKGNFKDYSGSIQFDSADPAALSAEATIQVASINTQNTDRDKHICNADFLDAEKFPTINFKSTSVAKEGDQYVLSGDFTLHGVTKSIAIPLTVSGPVKNPQGASIIGLSGEVTINRQDYGITWSKALDTGGLMLGNDVKVSIEIEAGKQAEVVAADPKIEVDKKTETEKK